MNRDKPGRPPERGHAMKALAATMAVFALEFALVGCGAEASTDPRTEAPLVRTAVVRDGKPASRSFTGTVGARVQSEVGFRVPGKITERFVDAGEKVRRGQPLMRIDPADLELAADAEEEAVDAARARVRQADKQADHYRDLRDSGKISDDEYDAIKADKDAAEAALDAAKDQADVARNTSRYTELVADADGVVEETLAEPGQVVAAGQTVVRLATGGPREAVVQLPETLRPEIGSTGRAALFGKKDDAVRVTLRQLSDAADPLTRTFEARYVLTGALADAPLGSTVTIDISDDKRSRPTGARVPIAAVLDAGRGPGVWLVSGTPAKVSWRPVTIERVDDETMYVSGEIEQGDRVVALGAHLMREGEQVRIQGTGSASRDDRP
jgi:RND family efflux transporter MFP subunit